MMGRLLRKDEMVLRVKKSCLTKKSLPSSDTIERQDIVRPESDNLSEAFFQDILS